MGYTPGLPPGILYFNSSEVQKLSNVFESGGIISQYPQSQENINYELNSIIIKKSSKDWPNESVASYVKNSMIAKGLINQGCSPKISGINSSLSFLMTFENSSQAEKAASLSYQISYGGVPLEIKLTRKATETSYNSKLIQFYHPRRVIVTNIDPSIIDQFHAFIHEKFQISGYFIFPDMNDCCLFDVCPPIQPECAALMLNNVIYGSRNLIARAFRSVIVRPNQNDGEYNVLADGVDFHQMIQPRTLITSPSDEVVSEGKTLILFNIIPEIILKDQDEVQMIRFDIVGECRKYGNVISCDIRPGSDFHLTNTYGVVVIKFEKSYSAVSAQEHLAGRRYMGRSVITMLRE